MAVKSALSHCLRTADCGNPLVFMEENIHKLLSKSGAGKRNRTANFREEVLKLTGATNAEFRIFPDQSVECICSVRDSYQERLRYTFDLAQGGPFERSWIKVAMNEDAEVCAV